MPPQSWENFLLRKVYTYLRRVWILYVYMYSASLSIEEKTLLLGSCWWLVVFCVQKSTPNLRSGTGSQVYECFHSG